MEQKEQTTKYLAGLLYLGIASVSLNVITDILVNDGWSFWLQLLLSAGMVACLYLLRSVGSKYLPAALFRAAGLLLNIALQAIGIFWMSRFPDAPETMQLGILITRVLGIGASVVSVLGLWFEYRAHGTLVSGGDAALQRKWNTLFFINLGVSLLYSLCTYVAVYLQGLLKWDISSTYALVLAILQLPGKVVYLLYLLYLYRTIRLVREEKGVNYG